MAIRLRKVQDEWVGLCAAKSKARKGDVYLDDGMHYALAREFSRDYGLNSQCEIKNKLMDSQERDYCHEG